MFTYLNPSKCATLFFGKLKKAASDCLTQLAK